MTTTKRKFGMAQKPLILRQLKLHRLNKLRNMTENVIKLLESWFEALFISKKYLQKFLELLTKFLLNTPNSEEHISTCGQVFSSFVLHH